MATTRTVATKNRIADNGEPKKQTTPTRLLEIPPLQQEEIELILVGDRPLMVNNKMNVAEEIADTYGGPGGKAASRIKRKATPDEAYARAFYVMPSSKHAPPNLKAEYGIPASGLKKCADKAIRTTGITDNTSVGEIAKSFFVLADEGGLIGIKFDRLERDIRPVNVGSGQKTVPQMRHRPMFYGWSLKIRLVYNPLKVTPESLANLFNHAGQYIGLCEMRAEKKQGECGGFIVQASKTIK